MTDMINQPLLAAPAWTEVAVGPIANILVAGPSGGWEVFVASTAPSVEDSGMPVASLDGAWFSSVLASGESVFARPFGRWVESPIVIIGMKN